MGSLLGLGKVKREVFERSVLPFIPLDRELELDGAAVKLTERTIIAHSPSIGVPNDALGFFAFHYAACNVACKFGHPTHMITGIYLPLETNEDDLRTIAKNLGDEARKFGVTIVAGQTAAYYGLEIPFVSTTCLGDSARSPERPVEGDCVMLAGEVGGEAVWLSDLSRGGADGRWRHFSALPTILALQDLRGVKMMHDVSEGGVKGALLEIMMDLKLRLEFDSGSLNYAKGANEVSQDVLRAPTYGVLVVISSKGAQKDVEMACIRAGLPVSVLGYLKKGFGLVIDDEPVKEKERIEIDALYGSFRQKDEVINELEDAVKRLQDIDSAVRFIPEVGLNMVYSKVNPLDAGDVAAIDGRVVVSSGKPKVCGIVVYGGSVYLSSILLELQRLDPSKRAAVVIRGDEELANALNKLGKSVVTLPSECLSDGCPVTHYLATGGKLFDAYRHPGSFGIEATTTIVSERPSDLIAILKELSSVV